MTTAARHASGRTVGRHRHRGRVSIQPRPAVERHARRLGDDTYGQTNVPAGLSGVTAITAGGFHGLALEPSAATTLTVSGIQARPSPVSPAT